MSVNEIKKQLWKLAQTEGFSDVRVTSPFIPDPVAERYRWWVAQGFHGEMEYLAKTMENRLSPTQHFCGAKSVLVFRADYYPHESPPRVCTNAVRIAKYAVGVDYHRVLQQRLERLLEWLEQELPGHQWWMGIDSAPLLERAYAVAAGIGFWGRNTMVITPRVGSYYFLALILTTAELPVDPPITGTCGNCTRCLDACPTGALVTPYVLDARRCISYLTIEKKSALNEHEKKSIGEWIFGCDICQDVCPYNKKPVLTSFKEFRDGSILHEFTDPKVFLGFASNRALTRELARSPLLRAGARRLRELASWFLAKDKKASLEQDD